MVKHFKCQHTNIVVRGAGMWGDLPLVRRPTAAKARCFGNSHSFICLTQRYPFQKCLLISVPIGKKFQGCKICGPLNYNNDVKCIKYVTKGTRRLPNWNSSTSLRIHCFKSRIIPYDCLYFVFCLHKTRTPDLTPCGDTGAFGPTDIPSWRGNANHHILTFIYGFFWQFQQVL